MPKLFTLQEVCLQFQVSARTLRRWLASTDFPKPIRTGRSRRWIEAEISAYRARKQREVA